MKRILQFLIAIVTVLSLINCSPYKNITRSQQKKAHAVRCKF